MSIHLSQWVAKGNLLKGRHQMNTATKLTPAEKAARTRRINKAWIAKDEMVASEYNAWVKALDSFCPPRDSVIDALEKKRDEAIAKIQAEFEQEYNAVMESFNNLMKPTSDALDQARSKAWEIWKDDCLGNF
jgi:hypothetical protein